MSALHGKLTLIHDTKSNYWKLPNGGIEVDGNYGLAIAREVFKETF